MEEIIEPTLTHQEQKVWDYIKEHKTPVSVAQMSKYFIISRSRAQTILALFERNGMVESVSVGKQKFYKQRGVK